MLDRPVFVTLTLDDYYLSKFKNEPKKPLLLYIDRLRKSLGRRPRYFFVSELGEENNRLHYHGILFGTSKKELPFELCRGKWKYGISWMGYCNDKTANYIVKYMLKDDKNYKPFVLCSNGIGASYLKQPNRLEYHLNGFDVRNYVNWNGIKYPLPAYYKNKLFTEDIKACIKLNNLHSSFEKVFNGYTYTDQMQYNRDLKCFYHWTLKHGLSMLEPQRLSPTEVYTKDYLNLKEFIHYGTVCFSESRACRHTAFQARFEFV